ncbi:phosphatidylserine decarboxylase [Heliomicrobium modesticaldum Ice1]|uniref:Phosphatidylserine decarboxylase proenzyme n=1 Tax=Heliobacterium modesticaldum (strain ATCC 51547 / Ice1) TaxID=498761 RepID=B0TC31_HELMI|nr:archaetidylserine decarboxylase [Heliomicrobium modesticaldum]ABZ85304.1 phosphatidylserine decarboxylase [Heliomicrobium modesticaldum Ice1]
MRRVKLAILHMLPQTWLSRQSGKWAASRWSRRAIPWFIRRYGVNLEEAEKSWQEYRSLADFFCRRLKPGMRPICPDESVIISPVDGKVSQIGTASAGRLIQAKGINYSLEQLLGDAEQARRFTGGEFITIYLSPRDYHRIHAPMAGRVTGYAYWPGRLYPVNELGVRGVPNLFARNERLITYMKTDVGQVAVIKVGAMMVGSVRVGYAEINRRKRAKLISMTDGPYLDKGDELGYFEFGSTVILLYEPGAIRWKPGIETGTRLKMGEGLAEKII